MRGRYRPSPGSVYPTLQMLEDLGYVTSSQQEGKKVYAITDEGRRYLDEEAVGRRRHPLAHRRRLGGRPAARSRRRDARAADARSRPRPAGRHGALPRSRAADAAARDRRDGAPPGGSARRGAVRAADPRRMRRHRRPARRAAHGLISTGRGAADPRRAAAGNAPGRASCARCRGDVRPHGDRRSRSGAERNHHRHRRQSAAARARDRHLGAGPALPARPDRARLLGRADGTRSRHPGAVQRGRRPASGSTCPSSSGGRFHCRTSASSPSRSTRTRSRSASGRRDYSSASRSGVAGSSNGSWSATCGASLSPRSTTCSLRRPRRSGRTWSRAATDAARARLAQPATPAGAGSGNAGITSVAKSVIDSRLSAAVRSPHWNAGAT